MTRPSFGFCGQLPGISKQVLTICGIPPVDQKLSAWRQAEHLSLLRCSFCSLSLLLLLLRFCFFCPVLPSCGSILE